MAILRQHRIDISSKRTKPLTPDEERSVELAKAIQTGMLTAELAREVAFNEENCLLLVPTTDGPLGALLTILELRDSGSRIDNVVPVYVENPADHSTSNLWATRAALQSIPTNSRPLMVTYNAGGGESIVNTVAQSREFTRNSDHISAAVRIQVSRIGSLQAALDDFSDVAKIDLGYFQDSKEGQSTLSAGGFLHSSDIPRTGNVAPRAVAILRQLLWGSNATFKAECPLAVVERVRAHILGMIGTNGSAVPYKSLLMSADKTYGPFSELPLQQRNHITRTLVESLVAAGILQESGIRPENKLSTGPRWNTSSELQQTYVEYYNAKVVGSGGKAT